MPPIDIKALKAKLAAKAAADPEASGVTSEQVSKAASNMEQAIALRPGTSSASSSNSTSNDSGTASSIAIAQEFKAGDYFQSLNDSGDVPFNHMEFMEKMNKLAEAIHTRHPQMPVLLKTIHTQLLKDPELVTILSEEGIGVIVSGLKVQTGTQLIAAVAKKTASKKTPVSLDMF